MVDRRTKGRSELEDSLDEGLKAQSMQTPGVKKALEVAIQQLKKSTCS